MARCLHYCIRLNRHGADLLVVPGSTRSGKKRKIITQDAPSLQNTKGVAGITACDDNKKANVVTGSRPAPVSKGL